MIEKINDNMIMDCLRLMDKSTTDNDYQPYNRNERCWLEHLSNHVKEQGLGNPLFIAIADIVEGELRGFMLASAFQNYYTQEWVMDVKDCIVNHDNNNARTVIRLFDYMIEHVKTHGGKHWRADSIRSNDKAEEYVQFLLKRYNAVPFSGVHGKIE